MNIKTDLLCFGILCSIEWQFLTDVSGQRIWPVFERQLFFLDCFTLEDWTGSQSQSVSKKLPFHGA